MEDRIKKMYVMDCITIVGFMAALWVVVWGVLFQVLPIVGNMTERVVIVSAGIGATLFSTAALSAVLIHLKNKKGELYREDIIASMKQK